MLTIILSTIISLWNLCPKGDSVIIEGHITAQMVVISDCDSPNMAPSYNVTAATLVDDKNRSTVFVQTLDGNFGLRLIMERRGENFLHRGDVVTFDFYGCTVTRDPSSDALTIKGVEAQRNILACQTGSELVPKQKTLAELTPRDINTYVTITNLDVVFKDGSWYNVHESWTRKMDGWASLLRGGDGRCIYMLLTNACEWRRNGDPLPQGTISVSGVLVHETNRRYGPDMGLYSIRPVFESDIQVVAGKSQWKTVTGWEKPADTGKSLDFEISGTVEIVKGGIKNDRILCDIGAGKAFLWTDSGSEVIVHSGYNSVSKDKKGLVGNAAIMFGGKTVNWYVWEGDKVVGTKAFYVQFDAAKMTKGHSQFSFEWAAGSTDGNKSWYYPVDWVVECSANGSEWILLKDAATGSQVVRLHNLPWSDMIIDGIDSNKKMKAGYDTAMGEQQHSFVLPQEVMAQGATVTLRIRPANTLISKIRNKPVDTYANTHVRKEDRERSTWIRFDTILIDHKK